MDATSNESKVKAPPPFRRVKTPTVLQMEAVECGAAALGIILGYFGRYVPLEVLRVECGVSRDGSKASNIVKAARTYGLTAKGYRHEPGQLRNLVLPFIVFWNFNHFLVVEGFGKGKVYLNDPASGPRVVSDEEFDQSFTGVVLLFGVGSDFKKGGEKSSLIKSLKKRLPGTKLALIFAVITGLALVFPGMVVPTFNRIFVDEFLVARFEDWIKPLLLAMGFTAVLLAGLTWLQQRYLLRLETKLSLSHSSKFLWYVLRLPMEFFGQRYAGEISSRVAINDRVAQLLSGELATTVLNIIMIGFYALLMYGYDVILTVVGVLAASFNLIALGYISRIRKDQNQKLLQERGKLMGTSMNGLQVIETLKATGTESDFFSKLSGYHAKLLNAEQELGVSTQFLSAIPPLLASITTAVILGLGGFRVMEGVLSIGMLVAFQTLMSNFSSPVNRMVSMASSLQELDGGMKRLDDVQKYKIDKAFDGGTTGTTLDGRTKLSGHLELKGISFGYNKQEPPLIDNFSLTLKPGSRVAIVGSSGCGKSTIAKLITGLYDPWQGEILFDGTARDHVPRYVLTNSLAMVDQDIFLFEGTVRENLTLWDSTRPDEDIRQAAIDACIDDVIGGRPSGYDTKVEEGGRNFSGGERQRMEIARTLVGNPTIIVLDEATSALDSKTELMVDDHLRRRGCTCVIIAHRLSTIRDCDEIIVLDRGAVVQRGTHDELIVTGGAYANLIQSE